MRILVVGDNAKARLLTRLQLLDQSSVIDLDTAMADEEIARQPPQVLVYLFPEIGGPERLRTLCAADKTGCMYVISVTGASHPPRTISSAFAAGSHDVLSAPYCGQELRARVDVRKRLRRWMSTRIRLERRPTAPPLPSILDDLRAWQHLDDVIADDFESMLGRALTIEERWPLFGETIQLATISMTLAAERLELCISIVADNATRKWLGECLLGDPQAPEESLDDILRELANVAGGALKRAALVEGPVFSTGIPVDGRSLPQRDSGARCWTIPINETASLSVIAEVRRRSNRQIPARRLSEGMIVVNDIRNLGGMLLLPSGTRLTSTTAQRLSELLGMAMIEVST